MAIEWVEFVDADRLALVLGTAVAFWSVSVAWWRLSETNRREVTAFAAVAVSLALLIRDQRKHSGLAGKPTRDL